MTLMNKEAFKKGFQDGVPIALGYAAVSFALGIAARNSGLSWIEATVMSLLNNTSAGEFAALELIRTGAPYAELAMTQLVINLRYLLMSCALSQKMDEKTSVFHRLLVGFDVTDEIFGISIAYPGKLNPFYSYGAIIISIPCWAAGTCFGVLLGNILPASVVSALSVALYGMFLAIVIPPARESKVLAGVVIVAMASSILFDWIPLPSWMSGGMKIIVLTVVISLLAAMLFPVKEDDQNA